MVLFINHQHHLMMLLCTDQNIHQRKFNHVQLHFLSTCYLYFFLIYICISMQDAKKWFCTSSYRRNWSQILSNSTRSSSVSISATTTTTYCSLIPKIRLCKYDCSFNSEKKRINLNKKQILLFTHFLFSFCVFASCLVDYTFNYSFVHSLFEGALLEAFTLFLASWIYYFFLEKYTFVLSKNH
jgi:hypothetical protein